MNVKAVTQSVTPPPDSDHELDYDLITIVFYPGSGYFRDMIFSTWYEDIFPNKQLADAQSSVTAPITDLL